jgi:hypothetical protein
MRDDFLKTATMDDKTQMEKVLATFYRDRLLPLAEIAAARGIEFFPLVPDPLRESYYVDRNDDGVYVHTIESDKLVDELKSMWTDDNFPELKEITDELVELANKLKEAEKVESSDEVSPFIYAMF